LEDEDMGDNFDVKIFEDPVFGTPIFEVISGESMCPAEEGTVAREKMQISAKTSSITGVPDGEPAVFEITLSNLSPVGECSELTFEPSDSSNLFGLRMKAFGREFSGTTFHCLAYTAKTIRVEVWRGPGKFFHLLMMHHVAL
tara:strand:+ start:675 stop:1100 length:426 start_codon:yes stop_codon:yes gene_type:complete